MQPVALITGAGRGIGRATAIELAKAGYALALVSRTPGELQETIALCGGGSMFRCDVGSPDNVERMVQAVLREFTSVAALVHCAGIVHMRPIEQLSIDQWQATIQTNLSAVFYLCRLLWPVWRKAGGGVVVNVSSWSARDPFDGLGAYGAAKAGVNLLGVALAREGAPLNIRVHTVAPAATETAMFRSLFTPAQFPAGNALDPADVAQVIAGCVTGDLRHTSGEVIYLHK